MVESAVKQPPLLEIRGLVKEFPGVLALDKVDFTLHAGEIHALLGENGAGKSTLIKTLTGVNQKDGGVIRLNGVEISPRDVADAQRLQIGTVYQEVNLLPNLSVAENLFLGRQPVHYGMVDTGRMRRRTAEILRGYGLQDVDPAVPLGSYSVAIQQVIAIARAVDLSAKVLILDEPTASLDRHEVQMLFKVMRDLKGKGIGIIFITHFIDQVYEVSDRITVLRNGRLVGERVTADLPRLELVSMMLGHEMSTDSINVAHDRPVDTSAPVVSFKHYGKSRYVQPFDLQVHANEVVGVAGLLGSGRTETAKLVFGIERSDCGTLTVNGKTIHLRSPRDAVHLGFGYCPEDRKVEGIVGDLSVRENIILALQARRGWLKPLSHHEQEEIAARFIKLLDIRTPDDERPVKFLSGGNQQKVLLARWLATEPRFLILDEPTRGIDVGAHAEIMRLINHLCADGLAMLVISSELDEIVAYSHRVVVMRDRRQVGTLSGTDVTVDGIMNAIATSA